jgi:hypothetical protein
MTSHACSSLCTGAVHGERVLRGRSWANLSPAQRVEQLRIEYAPQGWHVLRVDPGPKHPRAADATRWLVRFIEARDDSGGAG